MAYMCQGCSTEGEVWPGECPSCHSKLYLSIADKKADLIGTTINGRYKVVSKLGQGGMGTVYKAIREEMGQTLAIKMLNPEFSNEPEVVKRFLREAKSYGAVQHPNAVNLLDFGQTEDHALFIAMEYIAGQDLSKTIQERGRIPIQDALDICVQCCDVLGYAHEKGIIHRDLKPENIMLVRGLRSYHAKVLDFGIARLVSDDATKLTVQGTICGTPRYMSPEQARGRDIDNRSDIYSLGLVLFEMLCGRQAYTATSITDLLRAQVTEPVPHLFEVEAGRDLPEGLDLVIQRACAKDRDQRYVSMGAFADAISKALPTQHELRPFSDSMPALAPDLAAKGRTFLGPGAQQSVQGPPIQSAPNLGVVSAASGSQLAIPASLIAKSTTPAPILDEATLLRGAAVPTELRTPQSQTLPLASERPGATREPQKKSRTGLFAVLGVLVVAGIAAAVVLPKVLAKPEATTPLEPVAVVTTQPVAIPTPPPKAPDVIPSPPVPQPQVNPLPPVNPTVVASLPPANSTEPKAPAPNADPPTSHAHGKSNNSLTTNAAVRAIDEANTRGTFRDAERAFEEGRLPAALALLGQIDPKASMAIDAERLRKSIQDAQAFLSEGDREAANGECSRAIPAFEKALALSSGLRQAESGIARCKKGAVPTTMDGP